MRPAQFSQRIELTLNDQLMHSPNSIALQTRWLQRQLPFSDSQPYTPALLLFSAGLCGYSNREWERCVIQLLPHDKTSANELKSRYHPLLPLEEYQIALVRCIDTLRTHNHHDERFLELLIEHTSMLLTALEKGTLGKSEQRQYWDSASIALKAIPESNAPSPKFRAFQNVAQKRIWPDELPCDLRKSLLPSREEMLGELEDLLTNQQYDACLDFIRYLPTRDHRVFTSATLGFLKAGVMQHAIPLLRVLQNVYRAHPEEVEADLQGWKESRELIASNPRLHPPSLSTYLISKVCLGKETYAIASNYPASLNLEEALEACAPFPPTVSLIINQLLQQDSPNRSDLKRVGDYLTELSSVWSTRELQECTARLIRYFANHPFTESDQEEYELAQHLLIFASTLPGNTYLLHAALDAFPTEIKAKEHSRDPVIYKTLLNSLSAQITSGASPLETVRTWQRIYTCFARVGSPAVDTLWPPLPCDRFRPLLCASLKLSVDGELQAGEATIPYAAAYALLTEINETSNRLDDGVATINRVQRLAISYAQDASRTDYATYLPRLFEMAVKKGGGLEKYDLDSQEWALPILQAMAAHSSPWRFEQMLGMLRSSPRELAEKVLPVLARISMEENHRRFALYFTPLPWISPELAQRIYKEIAASPLFSQNFSYIRAAYIWFYYGQNYLDKDGIIECHLHWASRLIKSDSEGVNAVGLGIYRGLFAILGGTSRASEHQLSERAIRHGIPADALDQAAAIMQARDTYLSKLARAALLLLNALELQNISPHGQKQNRTTIGQNLQAISEETTLLFSQTTEEEYQIVPWLSAIGWTVAGVVIHQHERPDIEKHLERALSLVEEVKSGKEVAACERVVLGFRLWDALPKARLPDAKRTALLARLMEPNTDKVFFGSYPELKANLLIQLFSSPGRPMSRTMYDLLSKECFRLLASQPIPSHTRKEIITTWLHCGLQIRRDPRTIPIQERIESAYTKQTLTKSEYQDLIAQLAGRIKT